MNNVLQSIMNFVNENTILLICICGFLILVLIGYLIDTSIKAKKLQNDLEESNDDKKEMISNEKIDINQNVNTFEQVEDGTMLEKVNNIKKIQKSEEFEPTTDNMSDSSVIEKEVESFVEEPTKEDDFDMFKSVDSEEDTYNKNIKENSLEVDKKENVVDTKYTNNKKLSDILSSTINNEKKESNEESELERIMKKLDRNEITEKSLEETQEFNNLF